VEYKLILPVFVLQIIAIFNLALTFVTFITEQYKTIPNLTSEDARAKSIYLYRKD